MNLNVSDVTASDVTSLKDDQLLAAASSVNSILSDVHTDGSGSVNTTLNSKHSGGKVVSPRPHTVTSLAEVVSASAQQDNMQVSLLSQSVLSLLFSKRMTLLFLKAIRKFQPSERKRAFCHF